MTNLDTRDIKINSTESSRICLSKITLNCNLFILSTLPMMLSNSDDHGADKNSKESDSFATTSNLPENNAIVCSQCHEQ